MNPSSDTPTHIIFTIIFQRLAGSFIPIHLGGLFSHMDIPAMNMTHADTFFGDVPAADA